MKYTILFGERQASLQVGRSALRCWYGSIRNAQWQNKQRTQSRVWSIALELTIDDRVIGVVDQRGPRYLVDTLDAKLGVQCAYRRDDAFRIAKDHGGRVYDVRRRAITAWAQPDLESAYEFGKIAEVKRIGGKLELPNGLWWRTNDDRFRSLKDAFSAIEKSKTDAVESYEVWL